MKDFYYRAYDLNVASCVAFPELAPASGPTDVVIRYGEDLHCLGTSGRYNFLGMDRMALSIDGLCSFLMTGGNEIVIQLFPGADMEKVRLFILGSAFAAVLHQRGLLAMHGSAVVTRRGTLILTGDRGIGKSMLAAAFLARGYRLLADDVSAIEINSGTEALVHPAYPQIKLAKDAQALLGCDVAGRRRIPNDAEKYAVPMQESFVDKAMPLWCIFEIISADVIEPELAHLDRSEKFFVVLKNLFRPQILDDSAIRGSCHALAAELVRSANVRRIMRPRVGCAPKKLAEFLEAECFQ